MRANGTTNVSDFAQRVGIIKSALSKILLGQVGLSPANLEKLVTRSSPDPEHQYTILSAHLYDVAERSGFPLELLEIRFVGDQGDKVPLDDVSDDLRAKFRSIADQINAGDPDLGSTISWITGKIDASQLEDGHFGNMQAAEELAEYNLSPQSTDHPA